MVVGQLLLTPTIEICIQQLGRCKRNSLITIWCDTEYLACVERVCQRKRRLLLRYWVIYMGARHIIFLRVSMLHLHYRWNSTNRGNVTIYINLLWLHRRHWRLQLQSFLQSRKQRTATVTKHHTPHKLFTDLSVHQMAPPLTEVRDIQLQLTTHLLTLNGRLSWPGWLTYSGRFTHISGHASAAGRVQDRESSPAKDRRSTTVPRNQLWDPVISLEQVKLYNTNFKFGTRIEQQQVIRKGDVLGLTRPLSFSKTSDSILDNIGYETQCKTNRKQSRVTHRKAPSQTRRRQHSQEYKDPCRQFLLLVSLTVWTPK